jgi:hypothetical protein
MRTFTPEFVRHIYTLDVSLKTYDKYTLSNRLEIGKTKLSDLIRLEPFKKKSNGYGFDTYLRAYNVTKWAEKPITGLRPHSIKNVSYGDHFLRGKKSFLICQLSEDGKTLIIDYFNSFYPRNAVWRTNLLNAHSYHL